MKVVDSPPGMTRPSSPSSCSGLRTSTASAPSRRNIATCSRKLPWRARTPIRATALPAADFEPIGVEQRARGDAHHRVAEPGGDVGEHLRVLEMRRRLDDRLPPPLGIARLEDAGADEDAVRAELHAER